jgi:hypothetical protein
VARSCRLKFVFSVCRLVSRRCHNISAMPRFHLPLIKPDVRVSRIRLSDKESRLRPREVARPLPEPNKPEILMQVLVGEA